MLAEIIDSICIKNDQTSIRQTFNHLRKIFLHVKISSQTRANDPSMNCLLPGFDFIRPLMEHLCLLSFTIFHFLFWDKQRMNNNLWRIRLDRSWAKLRTKDMAQICAYSQRSDRWVVGSSGKLERSSNNSNSSTLSFGSCRLEFWENRDHCFEKIRIDTLCHCPL